MDGIQSPLPIFLAGRWAESPEVLVVAKPGDPEHPAGRTFLATEAQYEEAADAAVVAFPVTRALPAYEREAILRRISAGIAARREELGRIVACEAGKPLRDALVEVDRAALTFRVSAEEAQRIGGEVLPLDLVPSSAGYVGITRRFPVGPVAAISPFNYPLNLAAHKVGPAIAAGCPIVLKPASRTPLSMLVVAEIIEAAGAPAGSVSVLPMNRLLGDRMVEDPRFALLSFTGSPAVGWAMKARAGRKRVVLELGGNAAVIIDRTAALDWAAERSVLGAFGNAGQACISVQRMFVHADVWDPFMERFLAAAGRLVVGDPLDPHTTVGPMIDEASAARTERWVAEAVEAGGRILIGGRASGCCFPPTVLVDTPTSARVCSDEVFAPVVVALPFTDFRSVIEQVNASVYGLQAGIFTNDLANAWRAFEEIHVGGVVVNDVPTYRVDHMPYGGVKESGFGREGIRWAIEDMTELKLMVMASPR